jgi:hypothetical protein
MILSAISNLVLLLPVLLTATPAAAPTVIHLPTPPIITAPATAPRQPLLVGQWMDLNHIPHTAPFVPEPKMEPVRCGNE